AAFAALAAALYSQLGLGTYLFLMAGALLTSLLAYRLSMAAERSQQRSRELTRLLCADYRRRSTGTIGRDYRAPVLPGRHAHPHIAGLAVGSGTDRHRPLSCR
ncbi:MAG: hypothetical protein ACJ8CR_09255, partial [Roseiflexaceae bacterium]